MFYGFLTLILNIFTLEFFLSEFSNTSLLKYPLFKKVKISRNYSFGLTSFCIIIKIKMIRVKSKKQISKYLNFKEYESLVKNSCPDLCTWDSEHPIEPLLFQIHG